MKKTKWIEVESHLHGDGAAILYQLEMRKALLESNKFPALKPLLESEIVSFQKQFDEIIPLYQAAQKCADADRAKAQTVQAKRTPAKSK